METQNLPSTLVGHRRKLRAGVFVVSPRLPGERGSRKGLEGGDESGKGAVIWEKLPSPVACEVGWDERRGSQDSVGVLP